MDTSQICTIFVRGRFDSDVEDFSRDHLNLLCVITSVDLCSACPLATDSSGSEAGRLVGMLRGYAREVAWEHELHTRLSRSARHMCCAHGRPLSTTKLGRNWFWTESEVQKSIEIIGDKMKLLLLLRILTGR